MSKSQKIYLEIWGTQKSNPNQGGKGPHYKSNVWLWTGIQSAH